MIVEALIWILTSSVTNKAIVRFGIDSNKAHNALDCDGNPAGYKEGTAEGERVLIEESQNSNGKVSVKNFW